MDKSTAEQVKALLSENQLGKALDLMIGTAQRNSLEIQNTLLLLKGKLAMINEQEMMGLLNMEEVMQQKLKISHAMLQMLENNHEVIAGNEAPGSSETSSNRREPGLGRSPFLKYFLAVMGILAAGFIFYRLTTAKPAGSKTDSQPDLQQNEVPAEANPSTATSGDQPLRVLDFPNLKRPFNFLDFGLEFAWADAEWISDNEIKLNIRYYLTCKSNMGICYRATIRIYADGRPIAPESQSNLDGWIEHNATATDDASFVLPAEHDNFMIEFSRDQSSWKRPFKILK